MSKFLHILVVEVRSLKLSVSTDWYVRLAQELALGVYGPVTTRSQLYLAMVAAWLRVVNIFNSKR